MKIEITESNKYSTKDIAKWIRQTLKEKYPKFKFSVTMESYSGGSSITVAVMVSPILILRNMKGYDQLNNFYLETDNNLTDEAKKILIDVNKIANKYNYDKSDSMVDYFDVNYYFNLHIGKWDVPYEVRV